MAILQFFMSHWDSILIIVAVAVILILLYIKGEKKIFFRILYALITEAEAEYGGKTGELKKAAVIANIYGLFPGVVKLFVTEKRLSVWIEEVLNYAKRTWAENAGIAVYINGGQDIEEAPP